MPMPSRRPVTESTPPRGRFGTGDGSHRMGPAVRDLSALPPSSPCARSGTRAKWLAPGRELAIRSVAPPGE